MKLSTNCLFITACAFLSACTNMPAYQQPDPATQATAIIKLNNQSLIASTLGGFVLKPDNSLMFLSIDGKSPGFFRGSTTKVTPGKHQIVVRCDLNGGSFGEHVFNINALAGKVYTISYPKIMQGYHVDLTACGKLTLS